MPGSPRPSFECPTLERYLSLVATVSGENWPDNPVLFLRRKKLHSQDALALARWILEMFGE
mgnify:CR=1 FL=1